MNYEIIGEKYPLLHISLAENEQIKTNAGTLQGYTGDVKIESKTENGTSWRKWTASIFGKSIFQTIVTAKSPANLRLSTKGSLILPISLQENQTFYVAPNSFLACFEANYEVIFKSMNAFLKFEGTKNIHPEKKSIIFLEIFGEFETYQMQEGSFLRIDEDYLVGFEESVLFKDDFNLKNLKTSILSDADFTLLAGKGNVWLQSRKPPKKETGFLGSFF